MSHYPGHEQPGYGEQAYGQPAYDQPPYGQPAYGPPPAVYGQDQYADQYADQYGQGGYGQPAYGQPAYPYQAPRSTNTMAILSLVFSFVVALLGLIFGIVAKKQIKETGEEGDGLATAGIVISAIHLGIIVIVVIVYAIAIVAAVAASSG